MARVAKPYTFPISTILSNYKWERNYQVLYDEFDGNVDDTNIKDSTHASPDPIDASKLLNSSILGSKLVARSLGDGNMDYTDLLVLRGGPNISNNGVRLARGEIDWTVPSGTPTSVRLWIPFATTATDGDPIFGVAPRVILTVTRDLGVGSFPAGTTFYARADAVFATGVLMTLIFGAAPSGTPVQGKIYWAAEGGV